MLFYLVFEVYVCDDLVRFKFMCYGYICALVCQNYDMLGGIHALFYIIVKHISNAQFYIIYWTSS
jgi:hypothetical protein